MTTLDELRRLEGDATDPEWKVRRVDETHRIYIEAEDDGPPRYITLAVLDSPANARLIAAARNALPALLRVAEAATDMLRAKDDNDPIAMVWQIAMVRAALAALEATREH